ncbi:hypothetical protein FF041_37575 [Streptomyces jumonjinensis]|uniref:Lipoprotein CseA n=1 Tax=Streptomyces jumonjinensis TaxID=1945 RepID=A0A646KUS4_STRJU|nr:hypothetical protein [Streptomyces jumonjinensis]
MAAGTKAIAVLVALGLSAACSTGGSGVQDEGSAQAQNRPSLSSSAAAKDDKGDKGAEGAEPRTIDVNPVRLVKDDPKVSAQVKAGLKPCAGTAYPVDSFFGNVTGGDATDVVVNVLTCADGVGLGTYVYREVGSVYKNVFASEDSSVYATIDRGDLVVTRQVYTEKAPVASPSAEDVTTYRWDDGKFTQRHWVRREFSGTVGEDELVVPEETDPSSES